MKGITLNNIGICIIAIAVTAIVEEMVKASIVKTAIKNGYSPVKINGIEYQKATIKCEIK